jgi:hypothetical protein
MIGDWEEVTGVKNFELSFPLPSYKGIIDLISTKTETIFPDRYKI